MIYLIYGPDIVSSRSFLSKLKSQYDSVETFTAKQLEKNSFSLEEVNLFGGKRLLVVEDYLPGGEGAFPTGLESDLVIWTDEIIKPPRWVDKALVFRLSEQNLAFKFLDAVSSGEEKQALKLLQGLLLENTPAELIVGSLARLLRQLTFGLLGEWEKISKSGFLQDKTRRQLKFWDRKKLKIASRLLLKTDLDIKSGRARSAESLSMLVLTLTQIVNS